MFHRLCVVVVTDVVADVVVDNDDANDVDIESFVSVFLNAEIFKTKRIVRVDCLRNYGCDA